MRIVTMSNYNPNLEIPQYLVRHAKTRNISPRDFLIVIFSFKRAKLLYKTTMQTLDRHLSKARRVIVVSDDDPTLDQYVRYFGRENLYIINKDECQKERPVDLGDAYSFKGVISWARNAQFKVARDLGYKYFVSLEDDYTEFATRAPYRDSLLISSRNSFTERFDETAEVHFRLLDSAPFLNSVGMAQGGDYICGLENSFYKQGYRMKTMNAIFYQTDREYEFMGRINEDYTAYIVNDQLGRLSITLPGFAVIQGQTQKNAGGATDVYKAYGTWLKSMYSVMFSPSCVSIGVLSWKSIRTHHNCTWKYCDVKVISSKCAKEIVPFENCMSNVVNGVFGRFSVGKNNFTDIDLNIKDAIINDNNFEEW